MSAPLLFSNLSDRGRVRETNEDFLGYFRSEERHLFVVADGMGGVAGGREASRTAVREVQAVFDAEPAADPQRLLLRAVQAANAACIEIQERRPDLRGMGTTLDLLLFDDGRAWWGHVGDSRIYRIAGGRAERITTDHTRVQQMLDSGLLTAGEAAEHPQRNVLSRCVGRDASLEVDISPEPILLAEGEAFLLCSDGLCDAVSDEELADVVSRNGPDRACRRLVELANERGGHDNITVQVVYNGKPDAAWGDASSPAARRVPSRRKRAARSLAAVAALLAVAAIAFLLTRRTADEIPSTNGIIRLRRASWVAERSGLRLLGTGLQGFVISPERGPAPRPGRLALLRGADLRRAPESGFLWFRWPAGMVRRVTTHLELGNADSERVVVTLLGGAATRPPTWTFELTRGQRVELTLTLRGAKALLSVAGRTLAPEPFSAAGRVELRLATEGAASDEESLDVGELTLTPVPIT